MKARRLNAALLALGGAWLATLSAAAQSVPLADTAAPVAADTQRSAARVLTLEAALRTAYASQPLLRRAQANVDTVSAQADQARAPLLPQLDASASYERTTANFTPRPGQTPPNVMADDPTFELFNFFTFQVGARQLIYDFGQTPKASRAARARVRAQEEGARASLLQVEEDVRVSYFQARAARALIDVARETLENYERHLHQVEGFVRAGARAEIDLAQVRTDRANARVDLIVAENAYVAGKARLNRAIGVDGDTEYDVTDEILPMVEGEDAALEVLYRRAVSNRPELSALTHELKADELAVSAARGGHGPSLGAYMNFAEAGVELDALTWNWEAGVSLIWPLFQGGAVFAKVAEARAQLEGRHADDDALRQQVRLEVEQARLAVRAAKAVLGATEEAVLSAKEQSRLADGRYQAGVGSALELSDAQLAFTSAAAQQVRADYELSTARARLLRAVGE